MIEVLMLGATGVVLVELESAGGAEVGGFDVAKDGAFVLGVTIVVLVELKSAEAAEVGGVVFFIVLVVFDLMLLDDGSYVADEGGVLVFGVSATDLMLLDAGTSDAEEGGVLVLGVTATGLILLDAETNDAEGGVLVLGVKSTEGVDVRVFDVTLVFGVSVTGLMLDSETDAA